MKSLANPCKCIRICPMNVLPVRVRRSCHSTHARWNCLPMRSIYPLRKHKRTNPSSNLFRRKFERQKGSAPKTTARLHISSHLWCNKPSAQVVHSPCLIRHTLKLKHIRQSTKGRMLLDAPVHARHLLVPTSTSSPPDCCENLTLLYPN